jgi:transcriptional antiterminator NusG
MDDPNLTTAEASVLPQGNGGESAHDPVETSQVEHAPGDLFESRQEDDASGPPVLETHTVEGPKTDEPSEKAPAAEIAAEAPPAEPPAPQPEETAAAQPEETTPAQPAETAPAPPEELPASEAPKSEKMDWYILKVQSNREESIREGLRRKIMFAGLDPFFGDIIIPTEKVTEFKAGKRKVFKRKLYPGYLVVQMEINEDTWFLVRETAGIGDFTGAAGHPTPMLPREVAAILAKQEEKAFRVGDHVKIKEGTFENFEGEVANIDETNGRVTVLINIFGRSTPVDIEYWQIETV